jgi:quinol monooxygenase YgiN
MSVLVVTKFTGDTDKFRQALTERTAEFQKHVDASRSEGCLRHQFGIGADFVLVVDEWESAEQFQQFFSDPALQEFIATVGASPEPPQVIAAEALTQTQF